MLGIDASFWLNLERRYQASHAREDERTLLGDYISWLDDVPVKELLRRGWIAPQEDRIELLREVLRFFGVTSPETWADVWASTRQSTALRQAKSSKVDFGTVAVWLRKGEIDGRSLKCDSYNEAQFRKTLGSLRSLSTLPPRQFCSEVQTRCAAVGVAVTFVQELPRLRIFGAARWLSAEKALIQLSLHYKSQDQLWFSFFHEAAHVLLHGRRDTFVDFDGTSIDREEAEANRFAQDQLIPPQAYAQFVARKQFSTSTVQRFARDIAIDAGIVVGRLQHDKWLGFNQLTRLRRPIDWPALEQK